MWVLVISVARSDLRSFCFAEINTRIVRGRLIAQKQTTSSECMPMKVVNLHNVCRV